MIVNKKLIQRLIKESVYKILVERKLLKAYDKVIKDMTPEDVVDTHPMDLYPSAGFFGKHGNDFTKKTNLAKLISSAFKPGGRALAHIEKLKEFASKMILSVQHFSAEDILAMAQKSNSTGTWYSFDLDDIAPKLFGSVYKDLKGLRNEYKASTKTAPILISQTSALINAVNAGEYVGREQEGLKKFFELCESDSYYAVLVKIINTLRLTDNLSKLKHHDEQRDLKRDFITQNKEELKKWVIVHYPGAYSSRKRQQQNPLVLLEKFLKITLGKNNKNELSGVAYPKNKLKIIDGLALGGYGGRGDVPYPGVVCDGFITYLYNRDANTSTFARPFVGGFRGENEAQSGFVKYPRDLKIHGAGMSDGVYNPQDFYFKKGELEDYRKDFLNQMGGKTPEEASAGKYSYNEGVIDNWTPKYAIGAWDKIVAHYKSVLESPDRMHLIANQTLETIKRLRLIDIEYLDINFQKIDPESFLGEIEKIAAANPE